MPFIPVEETPRPKFVPVPEDPARLDEGFASGQLPDITPGQAALIAQHRAKQKQDPTHYIRGAVQAGSGLADLAAGAAGEIVGNARGPSTGFGFLDNAKYVPALAESFLRGSQDMGQIGVDAVRSQVLDPLKIVKKAVEKHGIGEVAARVGPALPYLLGPGMSSRSTRLLSIFPQEAAEVAREGLLDDRKTLQDRQELTEGKRSLLEETVTAASENPDLGAAARPEPGLAQVAEAGSNLLDPTFFSAPGVKLGARMFPNVAKGLSRTPAHVAAMAAKDEAARAGRAIAAGADNLPIEQAAKGAQPPLLPDAARQQFADAAARSAAQGPTAGQAAASAGGKALEVGGRVVGGAAELAADGLRKIEKPLSVASTIAGYAQAGIPGGLAGSMLPTAARHTAEYAAGAQRAGQALKAIGAADWRSSIPVWQQIAKNPQAPKWLVRGVTANVARNLKLGQVVEGTLRTGADLADGTMKGAAFGAGLAAADTDKTAEELGGAVGSGGILGFLGTAPALGEMKARRKMEAFAYDSMKKAAAAIAGGADPLVIAQTPDSLMQSAVVIENLFRGSLSGGRGVEVVLMDGKQFEAANPNSGAAAMWDLKTGKIHVNVEAADAAGRQLHEVGHGLMATAAASSPAIVEHFRRILGPDGLARARQDYQQALGSTVPQDDTFIVGELFSEAVADAFRGVDLNEALPATLGRERTVSFFRDGDVRKALRDPSTQDLVRQQFEALQAFRPAVDLEREPGVKLRPDMAGTHPALTKDSDFVTVAADGRPVATPDPIVRTRVRSRRKEVMQLFPDSDPVPDGVAVPPDQTDVRVRQTIGGLVQKRGTRLGEAFYATARSFGEATKNMLRRIEQAIANGETLSGWYQQIGQSDGWAASVRETLGAIEAQFKDFIPFAFKVDKQGNLLVENYSLSALERKAQAWAARGGPLSLELWGGDINAFRQDVQTYLKNHAEGRPGSDGLGEGKKNLINVFLVGGNRAFEAVNPLRAQATGKDRQGIVRSYRADRLQTVEPSEVQGFQKPQYDKQVRNLSPKVSDEDRAYLDAVKRGDMETVGRMVQEAAKRAGATELPDDPRAYVVRRGAPPQKTVKAYKLFATRPDRPGELFPLFVGAKTTVPRGVWLDAVAGEAAPNSKTGKQQVKSSLGPLAYRPGWHAGDLPLAAHIGTRQDGVMHRRQEEVWAEVELAADRDYQPAAKASPTRDLRELPVDGVYRFKTNPQMDGEWLISGSMKVNRILPEATVNAILRKAGKAPMPWVGGKLDLAGKGLNTKDPVNNRKLLDPVTYDDKGNVIPLSKRFNAESTDPRFSPEVDLEQSVALPDASALPDEHDMGVVRSDRRVIKASSVKLDPAEHAVLSEAVAKALPEASRERTTLLRETVRRVQETKANHPISEGWAGPLILKKVEFKPNRAGKLIPQLTYEPIPYSFHFDPATGKDSKETHAARVRTIGRRIVQAVDEVVARAKAGDKAALVMMRQLGWYKNMADRLTREIGGFADLFADLLGGFSPNTDVPSNWDYGIEGLRKFTAGHYDALLREFSEYLDKGGTPDGWRKEKRPMIVRDNEKLFGMNSINGMKAMVDLWRLVEAGQAPKARNFALNLVRQSLAATIDVWAARFLQRMAKQKRIPVPAEAGVQGTVPAAPTGDIYRTAGGAFGFGQEALARATQELRQRYPETMGDMEPPDLQALVWFLEKELWAKNNWTTKSGEGGSFEAEADKTGMRRYLAGVSQERPEFKPTAEQQDAISQPLNRTIAMMPGVLATRMKDSLGYFMGTKERSFDLEVVADNTFDPGPMLDEVVRIGREKNQDAVFVSRVLEPGEENPNARPGFEVYFKDKQSFEQALPAVQKLVDSGLDGLTMIVDPRTSTQESPDKFIGVRFQYVPEFAGDTDWQGRARELHDKMEGIREEIRRMEGVSRSAVLMYDTLVVGRDTYDNYSVAGDDGGKSGKEVWTDRARNAARKVRAGGGEVADVGQAALPDGGPAARRDSDEAGEVKPLED